jgi:hypothetical protein
MAFVKREIGFHPPADPGGALAALNRWSGEGIALLRGDSAPLGEVSHRWMAHLAMRGRRIFVVDCAIRLNLFRLVDEAVLHDVNPDALLASIFVQRLFTPYHILEALTEAEQDRSRDVTFLLAPMKQFFDGDVGEEEGLFLLERFVSRLGRTRHPFLIIEKDHYPHPSFAPIFPKLEALSRPVWTVRR